METFPLEMDDIFDANDDDGINATRLPDLDDLDLEGNLQPMTDSREENYNDNAVEGGEESLTDNPELLAKLKSLKGASKNVQRRTYIKLDATRLTGERGIPILPKIFKNVKLKGKHHEAEDLKAIMHHLEHWGHRLFPKMPFAEVLERTERLGAKKPVQTCVKRIRLGLPILADEYMEGEENVRREGDGSGEDNMETTTSTTVTNNPTTVTNSSFSAQIPGDDEIDEFLCTAAELEREQSSVQSQRGAETQPDRSESTKTDSISEEAKTRIERNKKLAMERRAARLAKSNTDEINNLAPPTSSLLTESGQMESSLKESHIAKSANSPDNSIVEKTVNANGDDDDNILEGMSEQLDCEPTI